jgi:ribonuclease HI
MKEVNLYADGACSGNPGPGGYGAVLECGGKRREMSAGFVRTTNNRMELRGVIAGLESLKEPCVVRVVTDSQYVVNGIGQGWAAKWRSNGWMRNRKEKALNSDLWERLLNLCDQHTVTFTWVRGHAGHPMNERCDALAVAAISGRDLAEDDHT